MAFPSRIMGAGNSSLSAQVICGEGAVGLVATGTTAADALQLNVSNKCTSNVIHLSKKKQTGHLSKFTKNEFQVHNVLYNSVVSQLKSIMHVSTIVVFLFVTCKSNGSSGWLEPCRFWFRVDGVTYFLTLFNLLQLQHKIWIFYNQSEKVFFA